MKLSLRLLVLTAALATVTQLSAADRWSTDETAVRMGVQSWLSLWARPTASTGDPEVKGLYATQPDATLPGVVQAAVRAGALPSAMNHPGKFAVSLEGDRAVVTFQLRPQGSASAESAGSADSRVVLTWERRSGLWQIVRESITTTPAVERVAMSAATGK